MFYLGLVTHIDFQNSEDFGTYNSLNKKIDINWSESSVSILHFLDFFKIKFIALNLKQNDYNYVDTFILLLITFW